MNSLLAWHTATSVAAASKGSSLSGLLLPLLLVVAFYFLLIRPQRNRQKAAQQQRSQLEPGARIVTIGGLFGTVTDVTDEDFGLQIAPGVEVRFAKNALGRVVTPEGPNGEHEAIPEEPEQSGDAGDSGEDHPNS